jgi:hypothetical protein
MIGILLLALAQHAVISARAGMVTYTEGVVNVRAGEHAVHAEINQHVGEGNALATGPSGRAEIMLTPDSYLRVLPYTGVRLESEQLDRIVLRLTAGAAIADIDGLDHDLPIRVHLNGIEIAIRKDGIYLFEPDRVAVIDGELAIGRPTSGEEQRLRKGRSLVRMGDSFSEVPTGTDIGEHSLVRWNEQRSDDLTPSRRGRQPRGFRF